MRNYIIIPLLFVSIIVKCQNKEIKKEYNNDIHVSYNVNKEGKLDGEYIFRNFRSLHIQKSFYRNDVIIDTVKIYNKENLSIGYGLNIYNRLMIYFNNSGNIFGISTVYNNHPDGFYLEFYTNGRFRGVNTIQNYITSGFTLINVDYKNIIENFGVSNIKEGLTTWFKDGRMSYVSYRFLGYNKQKLSVSVSIDPQGAIDAIHINDYTDPKIPGSGINVFINKEGFLEKISYNVGNKEKSYYFIENNRLIKYEN